MEDDAMTRTEIETLVLLFFRDLHRHPELSWNEHRTIAQVVKVVCQAPGGDQLVINQTQGGIWFDLGETSGDAALVAFRADLDALPIEGGEQTGLEYASLEPGVMHACGHDAHTAMLLGFVLLVLHGHIELDLPIRVIFQRAEESDISGGAQMIQDGALEGVGKIYGLHTDPFNTVGVLTSRPGPLMANVGQIHVTVKSAGGHVAKPHLVPNPLELVTDMMSYLFGAAHRVVEPTEVLTLTPTICHAGIAFNTIPTEASMVCSVRHLLSTERREQVQAAIERGLRASFERHNRQGLPPAECQITWKWGAPSVINSSGDVAHIAAMAPGYGFSTAERPIMLGGEDFSYMLEHVVAHGGSGAFWFIGSGLPGHDTNPWHHCGYAVNPEVLAYGMRFWEMLASEF